MKNRKTPIIMTEDIFKKCGLTLDANFDGGSHWLIAELPFCLLKYGDDMRSAEVVWSKHSLNVLSSQGHSNYNFHVYLRNRNDVRRFSKEFSSILQKTRCSLYQCVSHLNISYDIKAKLYDSIDNKLIHNTGEQNEFK